MVGGGVDKTSPLLIYINMKRDSLDIYDELPEDMKEYLKYNGRHFNKKLCQFAISKMTIIAGNDKKEKLLAFRKEEVDTLLRTYKIELENNELHDYIYVANMCKADFLGRSIPDERHLTMYIKDVIDDVDAYDGVVFNRWYADMCRKGIPIPWEECL